MRRLFVSEVRTYPGRVAATALACAATAAGVGACLLLFIGVGLPDYAENSVAARTAQDTRNLLSLLLSMLLMCAVVVIGSTVSLWTRQRLDQFAVLRALGVTAGRLRGMVALDVAALAVVSAALGAAAGMVPLAHAGRALLVRRQLFPAAAPLPSLGTSCWAAAAVCVGLGAVGVLAATASVLAAGRVSPGALLKDGELTMESSRGRARLVTGAIMAVALCGPLVCVMAFMELPATVRAAVAPGLALVVLPTLAALAPWLVPPLVGPVCLVLRLVDRRLGRIAAAGLRATPARTTAMAVPVLLAVGITVSLLGAGATVGRAVERQNEKGLRADGVLTAEPGSRLPATPRPIPGGTATPLLATEVTTPPAIYGGGPATTDAWGVDGPALVRVLDLGVREGRLSALRDGTFAAGAMQADSHRWRVGQRVRLTLADGSHRSLTLVAVYQRDLAFPQLVIPRSTALRHTPAPYADRILLTGPPRSWPREPGRQIASRAAYLADSAPRDPADDLAARLIVAVVAGYALLSAANTCSLAQRDRRSRRAHLRALGLGRFQLLRCVLYEAVGATAIGVALAAASAVVCLIPLSLALGAGPIPGLDMPWTLGVLAGAALAVAVPTTMTARPLSGIHTQFARCR
ncbi:FtsX-like permease family protein [Streptomyces sp. NPDC053499]|uniref:FtsX-like permease family protein n=1 Tax=Streptomyces sp. NPDC053499 TaxID=3365707 RepID=UPI0037D47D5C